MDRACVVGVLAVSGCVSWAEAGALAREDDEAVRVERVRVPDAAPPAPPPEIPAEARARPRVAVRADRADGSVDGSITAAGMPAIDAAGATVVVPELQLLQLSPWHGPFAVTWLSTAGARREAAVLDAAEVAAPDAAALRRRAAEINAALDAGAWRSLAPLPVEIVAAGEWDAAAYRAAVPAADRPVQAVVQRGELVIRVAGARVFERHRLAHPGHELHRLYGDRDTGVVVAVLGTCAGESCTCDPRFVAELLRWDDATFAAVERRPCAAREGGPACGAYDFFGVLDAARAPWT